MYSATPSGGGHIDVYNPEAEAFGAVVAEPDGEGIPSIVAHLCLEVADILELKDYAPETSGRLSMIIAAARELKRQLPAAIVKVPVSGPFSLASNLCGLENLLCDCLTDPEMVGQALKKLATNRPFQILSLSLF